MTIPAKTYDGWAIIRGADFPDAVSDTEWIAWIKAELQTGYSEDLLKEQGYHTRRVKIIVEEEVEK